VTLRRAWLLVLPAIFWLACRDDVVGGPPLPSVGGGGDASVAREAAAPAPEPPSVTVASFNVHRLFDTTCDTGACAAGDYEEQPTAVAFAAKVNTLAAGLRRLGADLVLLQEIETAACLEALAREVPEMKGAFLAETLAPASVDVGVLSRFPLDEVIRHTDERLELPDGTTTTFSRDLLEVHVTTPIGAVVAFVAHFRSKVNDDPERRLAEAKGARRLVAARAKATPGAIVILGGDLNDLPGSPPLAALEEGAELRRATADMPSSEIGTILYGGRWQAIDHFYVATRAPGRMLPGSFQVFREEMRGFAGSDHGAIRARFAR